MDLLLRDKVVMITGASGGIGRALADAFAEEGARLVLHGHTRFEALTRRIAERPWSDRALGVRADLSQPAEVERAFGLAQAQFERVDACVVNAGTWVKEDLRLDQISAQRLRAMIDANLLSAVWTAREFLRRLGRAGPRADGHGASITFIGSTAGRFGERGHSDYSLSKAALYGLVRTLKNEIVAIDPYGRVNMVEPGWTVTEMTRATLESPGGPERIVRTMPLRQIARARDVARAVLFLSSPAAARHVTGEVLTVAGGMEGRVQWNPDQIDADEIRRRLSGPD